MRFSIVIVLLFIALQNLTPTPRKTGQPKQQQPTTSEQPSANDQRGTELSPIVVKILEANKSKEKTSNETANSQDKSTRDWTTIFTGLLVLSAFLQVGVYLWQAILLRKTVQSAGEQSAAMERHIGEAARSADAMEHISGVIQSGNRAIIRAYVSVILGTAVFQERNEAFNFEGKPTLVNTGSTPARNLKIRISAEIVPFAQAETFAYALSQEVAKAPAVAAPHQNYILSGIVKDFVPDADVVDIKQGRGGKGALTVWGIVTYDDIFGDSHTTKFAQWLFWYPNNQMYGYYIPGQNDMD